MIPVRIRLNRYEVIIVEGRKEGRAIISARDLAHLESIMKEKGIIWLSISRYVGMGQG